MDGVPILNNKVVKGSSKGNRESSGRSSSTSKSSLVVQVPGLVQEEVLHLGKNPKVTKKITTKNY